MSRPRRIPEKGDVEPRLVADRLGLSLAEFEAALPALQRRLFPPADETTGRYCIEAVDRWRIERHRRLFPELTTAPAAKHAASIFNDRLQRLVG